MGGHQARAESIRGWPRDSLHGERRLAEQRHRPCLQDRRGNIWVGTLGAGLSAVRRTTVHGPDARSKGWPRTSSMRWPTMRTGRLWVGTDRGLNRLQNGQVDRDLHDRARAALGRDSQSVSRIAADVLWVGTAAGAVAFRDGQFRRPAGTCDLRDPILAMGEDRDGPALSGDRERSYVPAPTASSTSCCRMARPCAASTRFIATGKDAVDGHARRRAAAARRRQDLDLL